MPLIARQRSRLAVLAVLALVGSLLAVSAVPVAAEDGEADAKAVYSACVGAAAEDAGFNDMAGSFAEDAANCLAHYGITKGTSEGAFSPSASVPRLQMALFLARAAGPAGITLPVASDQGFTDIDGYTGEIQDAINQVAKLGIMDGRSDEMFSPSGMVTRQDMAVHLAAFLDEAVVGPGGKDIDKVKPDDKVFTDIGDVSFSTYGAIRNLYEMGVTAGKTKTTFAPDDLVSRGQMASFITRALAHTNARPAGLSMQANKTSGFVGDTVELVASIRDSSHRPVANKPVDFFYLEGDDDKPFKADGSCTIDIDPIGGASKCEIDAVDLTTDRIDGNASKALLSVNDDTRVWAWTGGLGDEFDNDTTVSVTIDVSTSPAPVNTMMTRSSATSTAKFGDTVTFTFQVVDKDGKAAAKKGASVIVKSSLTIDADADGKGSDSSKARTDTHFTDASGKIELPFTVGDPDSAKTSDDIATLTLTVTIPASGGVGKLVDGKGKDATNPTTVMWDDDAAVATSLKLSSATKYSVASDAGKGASNTVEATLTDQYGDPVRDAKVDFSSSGTVGAPSEPRYTDGDGVARLGYLRDSAKNGTETFSASHTTSAGNTINASPFMYYWVQSSNGGSGSVVVVDTANDKIVVKKSDDGDIVFVEYDSNDHFTTDGSRKVLAGFEKDLGADLSERDLSLTWEIALDDNRQWDADLVSLFELTISDTTPPGPTGPGPDPGPGPYATVNAAGTEIVVMFDENVDDVGTWTATAPFKVTAGKDIPISLDSAPSANGASSTVALTLSGSLSEAEKALGVKVVYDYVADDPATTGNEELGVKDVYGNVLKQDATWTLKLDTTPPVFKKAEPNAGSTAIVVTFDENVDDVGTWTATAPFKVMAGSTNVPITDVPQADGNGETVTLTAAVSDAHKALGLKVVYDYVADDPATTGNEELGVKDVYGNVLKQDATWTVTVDTTPPVFKKAEPNAGSTAIVVTFDENVDDVGTWTATAPFKVMAGSTNVPITDVPQADGNGETVTLTAAVSDAHKALGLKVVYDYVADDPATTGNEELGVKDVYGNVLKQDATWTVTVDTTPPVFKKAEPNAGSTAIVVTFDENVDDVGTWTATAPFKVMAGSTNVPITDVPQADGNGETVTLTAAVSDAHKALGLKVVYDYVADDPATTGNEELGVKDVYGNVLKQDATWTVTVDTTPPMPVSSS